MSQSDNSAGSSEGTTPTPATCQRKLVNLKYVDFACHLPEGHEGPHQGVGDGEGRTWWDTRFPEPSPSSPAAERTTDYAMICRCTTALESVKSCPMHGVPIATTITTDSSIPEHIPKSVLPAGDPETPTAGEEDGRLAIVQDTVERLRRDGWKLQKDAADLLEIQTLELARLRGENAKLTREVMARIDNGLELHAKWSSAEREARESLSALQRDLREANALLDKEIPFSEPPGTKMSGRMLLACCSSADPNPLAKELLSQALARIEALPRYALANGHLPAMQPLPVDVKGIGYFEAAAVLAALRADG